MPLRLSASLATAAAALALTAAPAWADEDWTQAGAPESALPDQQIAYPGANDNAPHVAPVGDVNGDGLDDFALSRDANDPWVTFSRREPGTISAGAPGTGFVIQSPYTWYGVKGIGDVNGDGLDDIAIATWYESYVVYGKRDDAPVDLADLGRGGFTIAGAGVNGGSGSLILADKRLAALGDVNGDGVPDLLLSPGTIIYPSADLAGATIDATRPGPHVSLLRGALDGEFVDDLGTIDGHHAVMIAGTRANGDDYGAYGAIVPAPGESLDLDDAVAGNRAFLLTADSAGSDWWRLESALTLGDENGDGRREVALVGIDNNRYMRVAFSPPFGTTESIRDLGAADSRGYGIHVYTDVVDVGDQNGDGRGDFAVSNYVYYSDPARETGTREPVDSGYWLPRDSAIGTVADLNGDGRRELASATRDSSGIFYVDVWDSIRPPSIGDVSVSADQWVLTASFDSVTGAGDTRTRQPVSFAARAELSADGATWQLPVDATPLDTAEPSKRFDVRLLGVGPDGRALVRGKSYRLRVTVNNGRGGRATGAWTDFTYNPATSNEPPPSGTWISYGPLTGPPPAPPWGGVIIGPPPSSPRTRLPRHPHTTLPKVVRGTNKADRLWTHDTDERIFGLGGNDTIDGAGGNDFIDGGSGNDKLVGGTGNDDLIGGGGKDKFAAGAGNDWINSKDGKREIVDCGSGKDTVVADKLDRVKHCEKVTRRR